MRAATAIVGAVAVTSILIALAFILSGGSSGQAPPTKTVTEKIVEASPREEADQEEPASGVGSQQIGGPAKCGSEYAVENVSCELGGDVRAKYESGSRQFQIKDPESGEYLEFSCGEPTPVICKEVEGPGSVSFG